MKRAPRKKPRKSKARRRAPARKRAPKRRRRVARGQFYKLTWKQAKRLGYTKGQWSRLKYDSQVAAQKRRADKKKYGSESAARETRRREREERLNYYRADRAAWRAAFRARHGREPGDDDEFLDYNYTWKQRYAQPRAGASQSSSSPPRSSAPRSPRATHVPDEVLARIAKLDALGRSPNEHEARLAKQRAAEMRAKYGIA